MSDNTNQVFLEHYYEVGLAMGLSEEEAIEYAKEKFDECSF
jgi:hypothetical protein